MSAVQAPALIVVTGSAIIVNLLHKGFAYIDPGDLTFVVVTDTTAPNAFKDAVQGGLSDASSDPPADPKEILGPEIGMNIRVLEAATDTPTIKRAISTSSVIILLEPHEGAYIYTGAIPSQHQRIQL
ncbi:hypothetical protein FRB91_006513 [Serendipita sp. 411]|nr:hypothetical protein FRB91_006513 [Serendipita sp. 411]